MFELLFSRLGQAIVLPSASVRWTLAGRKKPRLFSRGFMFALDVLAARGSEASAASGRYSELSEWQRSIKSSILRDAMILSGTATGHYPLRQETCLWHVLGKEKPPHFCGGSMFALPIFTASHPATIVGVHVLNFCVRDGNRWTHMTINTNYINGCNRYLTFW